MLMFLIINNHTD